MLATGHFVRHFASTVNLDKLQRHARTALKAASIVYFHALSLVSLALMAAIIALWSSSKHAEKESRGTLISPKILNSLLTK